MKLVFSRVNITVLGFMLVFNVKSASLSLEPEPVNTHPDLQRNEQLNPANNPNKLKIIYTDKPGKHGIQIKPQDETTLLTFEEANKTLQKQGGHWRLPTISELGYLYQQRKQIGGFSDEDYWSATEQDVNSAWIQGFRVGDQDRYNKHSKIKVRAVRSF